MFLFGATGDIIMTFLRGIGAYINELPTLSNWIGRDDTDYFHGWTAFYWVW